MSQAVFISDIHINDMQDKRAGQFLDLLKQYLKAKEKPIQGIPAINYLFLVGDIFDFWIADHRVLVEEFRPIIECFEALQRAGVRIHYFEGNHDLHLKYFWQQQLQMTVHTGAHMFVIGNRRVRVEHGDQMDSEDRGYLFLRWFLRTPPLEMAARKLPGIFVKNLGQYFSAKSRAYTSEVKTIGHDETIKKIHQHADRIYAESPFDLLVTGHLHVRDHYVLKSGAESWNLGTWLKEPGYLLCDHHQVRWIAWG